MFMTITPRDLKLRIRSGFELALLDLRDEGDFIECHLFHARSLPLYRLKASIDLLVPRRAAPVVLMDSGAEGSELANAGAGLLKKMCFTEVLVLQGGLEGWRTEGYEIFSGTHVPSKAFGEFVELNYSTPHVSAGQLDGFIRKQTKLVVLDARPFDEYQRMNIPTGVNTPGAELVYRIHDIAPDPETMVVVNCAGRTRSIIGAQSLINAGVPNPVFALKDGTAGWQLAGLNLERGSEKRMPEPSEAGIAQAQAAAERVAKRFGVRRIGQAELDIWKADREQRTLYLFDVRLPEEFRAGHMSGFRSAPGGQLIQATDDYVGVLGARIVLVDDDGVRATMTASWLIQLGWTEVAVLDGGLNGPLVHSEKIENGAKSVERSIETITPPALQALMKSSMAVMVVDLSPHTAYCQGHVPGAVWTTPSAVGELLGDIANLDFLIISAADDTLAHSVAQGLMHTVTHSVLRVLTGGSDAWNAAGLLLKTIATGAFSAPDAGTASSPEQKALIEKELRKYLTWEVGLLEQVRRDGDAGYRYFA